MKNIKIFRIVLICIVVGMIFPPIVAEEEENQNMSINFNQKPDVDIIPINDIINKTSDGSVELYAQNPSSNQFPLQVDFIAIIPSEIKLYSDTLTLVPKPEAVIGSFQVPAGEKREINIKVKSSALGNYSVQYDEIYYPVGNKQDNIKVVIRNYIARESSIINSDIPKNNTIVTYKGETKTIKTSSFISIGIVFVILLLAFLNRKKLY